MLLFTLFYSYFNGVCDRSDVSQDGFIFTVFDGYEQINTMIVLCRLFCQVLIMYNVSLEVKYIIGTF